MSNLPKASASEAENKCGVFRCLHEGLEVFLALRGHLSH